MSSSSGWSPERRQRQREAIQSWKPWAHSTGPRTPEGKATAAANSLVHGMYDARSRELMRSIHALLREQRQALEQVRSEFRQSLKGSQKSRHPFDS